MANVRLNTHLEPTRSAPAVNVNPSLPGQVGVAPTPALKDTSFTGGTDSTSYRESGLDAINSRKHSHSKHQDDSSSIPDATGDDTDPVDCDDNDSDDGNCQINLN